VISPALLFAQYLLGYSWSVIFPSELSGRFFNLCDECHWDFDVNYIEYIDWF
jgi:hypothetical protein